MRFLLLALVLSSCGVVEHARTNERFPVTAPENLAPPIVDPVVRDCARAVHVRGFVPGALVRVFSNDFEEIGRAAPPFGDADVALTRALDVEDILTATQTVDGVTSPPSRVPVLVESWPGPPRAPVIDAEVWQCGRVVHLSGLEDACRVEIYEDESLRGSAWSPGRTRGVVANAVLRGGSSVSAAQYACSLDVEEGGPRRRSVSEEAAPVRVREPPRDGLLPPTLDPATVRPGSDAVAAEGLYVGASVHVFVDGILAGEALATDRRTRIALTRPLPDGSSVTAEQELCELSPLSAPVRVEGDLPPPEIVGPVCDDDPWVTVEHGVLNGVIALLQGDRVVGTGGAQEGLSRIGVSGLLPGLPVRAVQYHGDVAVSDEGAPVRVCCCSGGCNADLVALQQADPEAWAASSPASCKRSRDPLFDVRDHPVLHVEIAADWAAVNGPGGAASAGTIAADGAPIAVTVTPRADPRFEPCAFRPVELVFERRQVDGPFAGRRRLTLQTACGAGDVPPEVDRRRLLMDYTVHRMFQELDHAGLDVRLAEVVYRDAGGAELHRELGFFQEEHHDACERCGWVRRADDPGLRTPDPSTRFAADLLDRFVSGTSSGREPIACADAAAAAFYLPWDWDLADVLRDEPDYPARAVAFDAFLGASLPAVHTRIQAWHITRRDAAMRAVLAESPLDPVGRERLLQWYDLYMKTLKCFLGFK